MGRKSETDSVHWLDWKSRLQHRESSVDEISAAEGSLGVPVHQREVTGGGSHGCIKEDELRPQEQHQRNRSDARVRYAACEINTA